MPYCQGDSAGLELLAGAYKVCSLVIALITSIDGRTLSDNPPAKASISTSKIPGIHEQTPHYALAKETYRPETKNRVPDSLSPCPLLRFKAIR